MANNIIKIPVFRTKVTEKEIDLFNISRKEMVESICDKIEKFKCSRNNKITIENSSKSYIYEIVKVNAEKTDLIDNIPIVLLQISAHKTNIEDGYIEMEKKIPVTKDIKIGSDHHYALMYPIVTKGTNKHQYCWNIFIYDDPYKESLEIIRIVKSVLKTVLNVRISNLKKKEFVNELRTYKLIPKITASFQTIEMINDQYNAKFKEYLVSGKIYSKKEYELNSVPPEEAENIINDDNDTTIKRKIFGIFVGKKEFKVTKTIKRDSNIGKERYQLLIESLFNEEIEITDDEREKKLYDRQFIIDKLSSVIANYMS